MDTVIKAIVALGVPGLVLAVTMGLVGWAGAAAITTALAALGGPFGMLGGIALLGVMALISQAIAKYGLYNIAVRVVEELRKQGKTKAGIITQIRRYPISEDLKRKIEDYLNLLPD
jgi:hypothetical protein